MRSRAKIFITVVCALGFLIAVGTFSHFHTDDPIRFVTYLLLAMASSGLRVSLPSIPGTLSAVFVFQFLGIIQLTLGEVLIIAWLATLAQNIWMARQTPTPEQVAFNVATVSLSAQSAFATYTLSIATLGSWGFVAGLLTAALVAYVTNTVLVATVIALVDGHNPRDVWRESYLWSFPYYLAGAALAGLLSVASSTFGWQTSLLILPVVYLFYRSYTTYTGRLEDAKNHAEEVSALHLRTIESLALAIEAKDDTTHAHLRRVQTYALAIGRELGLHGPDIEALRAAAILHDIGKLAVPEYIICKPGKLTHDEFEKMKIHPVVGAEILEHVKFPYPVAPIVRSHHEKWNGTGYPSGLKGEEIPIGARILAAVDCLDALASDRQYRRALPLADAMQVVVAESGKSFDPKVVEVLHRRYVELEKSAQAACVDVVKLSTNIKIERGEAPAAGFEASARKPELNGDGGGHSFLQAIAEARSEVQTLFELSTELSNSLSLPETLSLITKRLKVLIPHEAAVLWVRSGGKLEAFYVEGANRSLFESLHIPIGEGLAGWVIQNLKPILNGNPAVEPGYLNDPSKFVSLRSALAVPLSGLGEFSAVLAFYRSERDAFQKDHLRILLGISSKLAISIEHAIVMGRLQRNAHSDELTGLPNIKSLLERFDGELSRSRRSDTPVTVLVCDIDGLRAWNSRFGQPIGDRLLQEFGAGLRNMFREYDLVARLGGDEFAVVLPDINSSDLQSRIRQIHVMAMQAGRTVFGEDGLSITIGEAHFPADGSSVEDLLSKADRKLSLAKRSKLATVVATPVRQTPAMPISSAASTSRIVEPAVAPVAAV
jgi:diguanylate cyclase (GGDEF)-like protein/putative nucleotidyltransferase with HDIG domain